MAKSGPAGKLMTEEPLLGTEESQADSGPSELGYLILGINRNSLTQPSKRNRLPRLSDGSRDMIWQVTCIVSLVSCLNLEAQKP